MAKKKKEEMVSEEEVKAVDAQPVQAVESESSPKENEMKNHPKFDKFKKLEEK